MGGMRYRFGGSGKDFGSVSTRRRNQRPQWFADSISTTVQREYEMRMHAHPGNDITSGQISGRRELLAQDINENESAFRPMPIFDPHGSLYDSLIIGSPGTKMLLMFRFPQSIFVRKIGCFIQSAPSTGARRSGRDGW